MASDGLDKALELFALAPVGVDGGRDELPFRLEVEIVVVELVLGNCYCKKMTA